MEKSNTNGKGKLVSQVDFQGQEIEFPVDYQLKAVMTGTQNDDDNKEKIVKVFNKLKVEYKYHDKKVSSKGSYVSFTYEVTLTDKKQMDQLYVELQKIKELKFAV